jgi:hypothetical protein
MMAGKRPFLLKAGAVIENVKHQLMMVTMMVTARSILFQILLWLSVKGGFAARSAEVISFALIFRCRRGRFLVYFHTAYRIDCHDSSSIF